MIDYWGPAQQMLADNNFLASLKTYDKDNMSEALMVQIRPYIADPNFDPAVVRKASKAAYGLCCWIRAMESYDKVNKVLSLHTVGWMFKLSACVSIAKYLAERFSYPCAHILRPMKKIYFRTCVANTDRGTEKGEAGCSNC